MGDTLKPNALWVNKCQFARIGLGRVKNWGCIRVKFVAILSPLQKCNSFYSVAITTNETIELQRWAKADNLYNEIFFSSKGLFRP